MPEVGQNMKFTYDTEDVGEVQSISLSIDSNQIEVNSFDVGAINRYIKGRSDVTLSVTCLYTRGQDDGHAQLIEDSITENVAAKDIEFEPKTPAAGDLKFSGKARPSSVEISADDDEAQTISFDLQISETFATAVHPA